MKKISIFLVAVSFIVHISKAQNVDYSVVSTNQESHLNLTKISSDNDCVCMPEVSHSSKKLSWFTNRIIDVTPDGKLLGFVGNRNNQTNIYLKSLEGGAATKCRTNRQSIVDFSFSPDGENICFSEMTNKLSQIYQTSATSGYVCRQITSGAQDFSPVYSNDMSNIYFTRVEGKGSSIWSFNVKERYFSTHTKGLNPYPDKKSDDFYCARLNANGFYEIWKVNSSNGVEESIVSEGYRSFTTPQLSPNGEWLVMTGESIINYGKIIYRNLDVYVCKKDGTDLRQLTYHAADDVSPVWSHDGKFIYFISKRGSNDGIANVWRINFN